MVDNSLELESFVRDTRAGSAVSVGERLISRVDTAIFCALLVIIAAAVLSNLTVEPWWEAAFQCSAFALGALWIVSGRVARKRPLESHRIAIPLVVLAGFALVQILPVYAENQTLGIGGGASRAMSFDPYGTRLFIYKLLALVVFGELLAQYTSSKFRLRVLIFLIVGIGIISALLGIVEQRMLREASGFFLTFLEPNTGFGQFADRNHFALLMEMALGLALGLIFGSGFRSRWIFVGVAAVLPLWSALVLANSRAGVLTMLIQTAFVVLLSSTFGLRRQLVAMRRRERFFFRRRSLVREGLLLLCVLTFAAVSVLWIGGQPLIRRLESEPISSELQLHPANRETRVLRLGMWKATWELIKAHPITGVGFGGYWVAIPGYYQASGNKELQQAHNEYLEVLANGGLIGGAIAAWFLIALVYTVSKKLVRSEDPFRRSACLGALTGIVGVSIHSSFDFGLHITINAIIITALIVIATVDLTEEHSGLETSGTEA